MITKNEIKKLWDEAMSKEGCRENGYPILKGGPATEMYRKAINEYIDWMLLNSNKIWLEQ